MSETQVRLTGTTKWFDVDKGYGFVAPDKPIPGVPRDLFLHVHKLPARSRAPVQGDRLSFTVGKSREGRPQAENVEFE